MSGIWGVWWEWLMNPYPVRKWLVIAKNCAVLVSQMNGENINDGYRKISVRIRFRFSCEWHKKASDASASSKIEFYFLCMWKKYGGQGLKAVSRWLKIFYCFAAPSSSIQVFLPHGPGWLLEHLLSHCNPAGGKEEGYISLPFRTPSRSHTWHFCLDPVS